MPNSPVNLAHIRQEIEHGLENEKRRLHCAWKNRLFYEGDFTLFPTRDENMLHERWDMRRTSRIMRRVIHVLTSSLYKKPPTRTLGAGPEGSEWLNRCYKASAMQALWPEADRLSLVNDWCAFSFAGNEDPETIVDIELWASDELVVWMRPGSRKKVGAVATIEKEDAGRRLTLWTDEVIERYYTAKWSHDQTAGGTAWKYQGREVNPYLTIPFAFVHADYPTTDFDTPGIGDFLRQLNDYVNYDLDNLGDAKRYLEFPLPVASNVAPTWSPPPKLKPGQWIVLAGSQGSLAEETPSAPTLTFVSPDLGFVAVDWDDLNRYIDRALEDIGVPPGTIRLDEAASSGVQVMVEQGPLISWSEARRQPFSDYESEAARKCAEVAAAHLRANGHEPEPWLDEAARTASLALRWAPLYVQLPGVERDRSDEYRLANGYASKVQLLMEREDLTHAEAVEKLKSIEKDKAELEALGIEPGLPSKPGEEVDPLDPEPVEPINGE
jgi:hypothetical protein